MALHASPSVAGTYNNYQNKRAAKSAIFGYGVLINVEADSEEEAKEEIVDTSWDECLMDVVFDVVNLEEEE